MTPPPPPTSSGHWFEADPLWFKKAVFYEIHLRGFFDGNSDGSGDFRGLTEKLDYLQWLGIDVVDGAVVGVDLVVVGDVVAAVAQGAGVHRQQPDDVDAQPL